MLKEEKALLSDFVLKFIPPVDNNRKYRTTTMHSIYTSLQRIFLKFANVDLKWDDVLELFEEKDYRFMDAKWRYVEDIKTYYLSPNGEFEALAGVGERGNHSKASPYFYVNISPVRLNELRKTTKRMPPHVSYEILNKWNEDKELLEKFFEKKVG
tara:strand:+ start:1768 stop:2232 length:465 start_codon:yes stop_codon:yes gene_type:complete